MSETQRVQTEDAPAAIGPYSQAVIAPVGRTVYCSGQIGLDPKTGAMVDGGVEAQTEQVLDNMAAVLAAAGASFAQVVRTTIFLADMGDFAAVNARYTARFGDVKPARACVQAAALPKDARVEIDCIAVIPG